MRQYLPYILTGIIIPLVGLLIFFFQSRVRIGEHRETMGIKAESAPIEALQQTHAQTIGFMQSMLQRNEAGTKAMVETVEVLRELKASLHAHKEESSARAAKIYEKISDVNERVTGIEKSVDTIARLRGSA